MGKTSSDAERVKALLAWKHLRSANQVPRQKAVLAACSLLREFASRALPLERPHRCHSLLPHQTQLHCSSATLTVANGEGLRLRRDWSQHELCNGPPRQSGTPHSEGDRPSLACLFRENLLKHSQGRIGARAPDR